MPCSALSCRRDWPLRSNSKIGLAGARSSCASANFRSFLSAQELPEMSRRASLAQLTASSAGKLVNWLSATSSATSPPSCASAAIPPSPVNWLARNVSSAKRGGKLASSAALPRSSLGPSSSELATRVSWLCGAASNRSSGSKDKLSHGNSVKRLRPIFKLVNAVSDTSAAGNTSRPLPCKSSERSATKPCNAPSGKSTGPKTLLLRSKSRSRVIRRRPTAVDTPSPWPSTLTTDPGPSSN
mmetsp:Transcript_65841/g.183435  ORF Transcript_65841/g.183435 Transcript_65841/m.183435 type:complete len:241 (+) Transcript_65841:75-797(+)